MFTLLKEEEPTEEVSWRGFIERAARSVNLPPYEKRERDEEEDRRASK